MGWLAPQDAGAFHSLERLLKKHGELAHLTDAWGGGDVAIWYSSRGC